MTRPPSAVEPPVVSRSRYARALAGELPGEALGGRDRVRLVRQLHAWGWTDLEIAEHTRWTLYTTARIRDRIELEPNQPVDQVA